MVLGSALSACYRIYFPVGVGFTFGLAEPFPATDELPDRSVADYRPMAPALGPLGEMFSAVGLDDVFRFLSFFCKTNR